CFFALPLAGLVGGYAISPHAQGRHLHKALDARLLGGLHDIARANVMHSLEGVRALLDDDAHKMNDRFTVLYAFVEPGAGDNVAGNGFNPGCVDSCLGEISRSILLPGDWTQQRADVVALLQETSQHVPPDKACRAGEEDFHQADSTSPRQAPGGKSKLEALGIRERICRRNPDPRPAG